MYTHIPAVLPMRQRAEVIHRLLKERLATVLPRAMRETGFDMWLILCQEDNLDPVYTTMIPLDTWCPILQMLVFYDRGEEQRSRGAEERRSSFGGPGGVEGINVSGTNTGDLYDRAYTGQLEREQWPLLRAIIEARDPQRIGVNVGAVQWAAGGLTHNLYNQLMRELPAKYAARLASAEPLATRWLATLSDEEIEVFEHVVAVARGLIAACYSRAAIVPGVTTTADLEWHYWQLCADRGLEPAFKPYFTLRRSQAAAAAAGPEDQVIRPGDLIHCDVGIRYMRLNSDHQEWAYIARPGEMDAPEGMRILMAEGNRLQDIFMSEFHHGLTGNELLRNILSRARHEGIPDPRVYSHSLGLFLHEPGPLIGLPWEQEACPGRGDVALDTNNCFTMELSVTGPIAEWGGQELRLSLEQDVAFTRDGCRLIGGRQTAFHVI